MNINMIMVDAITRNVQCTGKNQWTITIPKEYASAMKLKPKEPMEIRMMIIENNFELVIRRHK